MNNQIQLVLKSSTTELSLNDHELGIYLTPELDGLTGLPEIRTTSGVNAGYDGGWTSAQNYDARSITIRGVIANEDVATVEQLRRQLTTLAGQGKNEELTLDLVTQAGKAYTIQVRTIALEMSLQKVLTQQEFMLQLRADDPLIYDASETGHEALLQVAQATGGFTIDFELPLAITGSSEETVVNNEGLEQVPTITRMYGALHNPKIINQTTNQFMQIEADLGFAEGDWIEPSDVVSGKDITINGAPEAAPLSSVQIDGETSQNGTPTPDAPVAVQTVTGENVVKICGKNLLKFANASNSDRSSFTYSVETPEMVVATKNTTGGKFIARYEAYFEAGKTYIFSLDEGAGRWIYIYSNRLWGTMVARLRNENMTFTPTTSGTYVVGFYTDGAAGTTFELSNTMAELGSTATDFEPYQEQSYEVNLGNIELCKIGDYQDYIYKSGGKWYVHKEVGKATYNGSENWGYESQTYYLDGFNGKPYSSFDQNTPLAVSPHFRWGGGSAGTFNFGVFWYTLAGTRLRLEKDENPNDTTLASFKTWLGSNNLTIYYALSTPTDTEITNEALIAQLEAILQGAKMHNPQTNITILYADGNEQPTLDVSYFTDKNPDTRDELVIDSRLRTITLNGLDVYHLQAPGSEFLMLAPGENRLALQSDITGDNGYAQVSYKQGYLSI